MIEVPQMRDERTLTPGQGKSDGPRVVRGTKTKPRAAGGWNGTGSQHGRRHGADRESTPQEAPRIRIDVPLGTSYAEIHVSVFRQAWQLAGTQLRAAIALGITADTISRVLRRCDREPDGSIDLPAHRLIKPSVRRIMERARQPSTDSELDQWVNAEIADLETFKADDE